TPLFLSTDDPFVVRFHVRAAPALGLEHAIPIHEPEIFNHLTFTKGKENAYWLGPLRRSLQHLDPKDGRYLEELLHRQEQKRKPYPVDESVLASLRPKQIKRSDGTASVVVPPDSEEAVEPAPKSDRESAKVQAKLAQLGETMGFRVWIPKNDRLSVLRHWG